MTDFHDYKQHQYMIDNLKEINITINTEGVEDIFAVVTLTTGEKFGAGLGDYFLEEDYMFFRKQLNLDAIPFPYKEPFFDEYEIYWLSAKSELVKKIIKKAKNEIKRTSLENKKNNISLFRQTIEIDEILEEQGLKDPSTTIYYGTADAAYGTKQIAALYNLAIMLKNNKVKQETLKLFRELPKIVSQSINKKLYVVRRLKDKKNKDYKKFLQQYHDFNKDSTATKENINYALDLLKSFVKQFKNHFTYEIYHDCIVIRHNESNRLIWATKLSDIFNAHLDEPPTKENIIYYLSNDFLFVHNNNFYVEPLSYMIQRNELVFKLFELTLPEK